MAEKGQVQGVHVEIFGVKYQISGDPRQVQKVAEYVDAKMKEIRERGPLPTAQVAMLAALEISDELDRVKSERKIFTDRSRESIERLSKLVKDGAKLVEDRANLRDEPIASRARDRDSTELVEDLRDEPVAPSIRNRESTEVPVIEERIRPTVRLGDSTPVS